MANLKDVIYLSNTDFETLVANGTVTINGTTLTYDENSLYITPDELATTSSAGLMPALNSSSVSTQSQSTKFLREDGTWAAPSYTSQDGNTWRKVQLNGTDKLGNATTTNPLNIVAGTNMSITESGGAFTFNATGIFWCTYGATTGEEIAAAITAGKYVCCKYNDSIYGNVMLHSSEARYYLTGLYGSYTRRAVRCSQTGATWTTSDTTFLGSFKVDSATINASTNTINTINANYNASSNKLATANDLSSYVPTSRTINSKALSNDISLNTTDILVGSEATHNVGDVLSVALNNLWDDIPTTYLKSATVGGTTTTPNNTLTITDASDNATTFTPESVKLQDFVENQTADANNKTINLNLSPYNKAGIWYTVASATIAKMANSAGNVSSGECMLETRPLGSTAYTYQIFTYKTGTTFVIWQRVQNNTNSWGSWYPAPLSVPTAAAGTAISTDDTQYIASITTNGRNLYRTSFKGASSSTTWDSTSDVYLPTMKAIKNYVTGLGYITTDTNYYPSRSYTSGLQISTSSGVANTCALYVPNATDSQAGVITTLDQTFAGTKTFTSRPELSVTTRLPNTYQEIKYIGATGTQYIDTGFKSTSEKLKVEFGCSFPYGLAGMSLMGSNSPYNLVPYGTGGDVISHWVGNSGSILPITYSNGYNDVTYVLDNGSISCNINGNTTSTTYSGSIQNNYNFYVFGKNGGGTSAERGNGYNLYYMKIYNNGTLVRDFVPCYRKSDNVIGLYDLVNNTFYTNAGSGTFNKGAEIKSSEFLVESDLSTVAVSGNYDDLSNKPTIPTSYVSSVNGSTGAITNVAKTNSDIIPTVNSTSGSTGYNLGSLYYYWNYLHVREINALSNITCGGSLKKGGATYTLPSSSGELALTSDCGTQLYSHAFETSDTQFTIQIISTQSTAYQWNSTYNGLYIQTPLLTVVVYDNWNGVTHFAYPIDYGQHGYNALHLIEMYVTDFMCLDDGTQVTLDSNITDNVRAL